MATTRARPEFASAWWWVALYVLSGYLSYRLGAVDDSIDYIWLPTGVTVGAFMLRPVRDWPLLGGLFLLAQWLLGGFELGRWLDALLYAVDDVGAAALAVWLIQRTGFALEGLYFLRSVIFAGLLAGVVAALGDAAWLSLRGGHATLGAVAIGAASSFVGVLLVTPVLASWSRFRAHRSGDHERFDLWLGIACFVLMVVSAALVTRAGEAINRNGRQLAHMVDDLLDSGAIVTGKLSVLPRPVDLGALAGIVIEDMRG
ncbi:MASE1 domain-containing protein, partial [Burkholderia gladioli]|nr:MASE1 domain-containing protein [Burkholderia gladioli]